MLFGEYLVLKGSDCLAFPLKFGQALSIGKSDNLKWESYDKNGMWFHVTMDNNLSILETNDPKVAAILRDLFKIIQNEKPSLNLIQQFKAEANFELNWGLGSSSTLISLLSQWSGVDSKKLLQSSFGGSGYDVACATAEKTILYANGATKKEVHLANSITEHMLFVYLGNKQNSREEIKRFKGAEVEDKDVSTMNSIIKKSIETNNIDEFEKYLNDSENLVSNIIGSEKLKERLFTDYPYSIKSLGAWGGDFFLATYRDLETAKSYFREKEYDTLLTYQELIK